jgi:uncharacterized protein
MRFLAFLFLVFLTPALVFAGQLEDGKEAKDRGDNATAYKLLQPLADDGNPYAQWYIGMLYEQGGVQVTLTERKREAEKWYRKAFMSARPLAENGDAKAQFLLGMLNQGYRGLDKNDEESLKWLQKSAENDYINAQAELAYMYQFGQGATHNYAEAAKWYRRAAQNGGSSSVRSLGQRTLGYMYSKGQGVPQDWGEAYFWDSLAAVTSDKNQKNGAFASHLTLEQKEAIDKRVKDWKPSSAPTTVTKP